MAGLLNQILSAARRGTSTLIVLIAIGGGADASNGTALRGVALIIGNSTYEALPALANPTNDARAVEALLDELGFETELSSDRDARRLRRDLENFVEDAEGADVAIIYYAGHGIEAGGENYLVPVDADLSALDAAGEKLVPISQLVQELQQNVSIAIVMLDACRDNPFPAGVTLAVNAGGEPLTIGTSGLGETRGATRLAPSPTQSDNFGTVIGFAAQPGRVALDGEPGGNSPYAAAILRHMETMAGEEFGTVMRMVAEEVYLKTEGRQQPWVNESLRRLIYFGSAPQPVGGAEGEILTERRKLLLTIASLPDAGRNRIEQAAREGGVPMDALYAMLNALGEEAPDDPAQLDALMRSQTDRLKTLLADRNAITTTDPEIVRLSDLADQAIREGALNTATGLLDQAKARVSNLSKALDQTEADIRQRRIEFAEVYGRSAQTKELAFDFVAAAQDYAEAFAQVERWDPKSAWVYLSGEARALVMRGTLSGDNDALRKAEGVARRALDISDGVIPKDERIANLLVLGNALQVLGERQTHTETLLQSAEAYRTGLEWVSRDDSPTTWAKLSNNLANTLTMAGERTANAALLREAASTLDSALPLFEQAGMSEEWGTAQMNLAKSLQALATLENSIENLERAGNALEAALTVVTSGDAPIIWGGIQNNLGNVHHALAQRSNDFHVAGGRYQHAVIAYRNALTALTRERSPMQWATAQNNLANSLQALGTREQDSELSRRNLDEAAAAQRAAMEIVRRDLSPIQWAQIENNLGLTTQAIALRSTNPLERRLKFEEALTIMARALEELTAERAPLSHAMAQKTVANIHQQLSVSGVSQEEALSHLRTAEIAQRAALAAISLESAPLQWGTLQHELGATLFEIARHTNDTALYAQAEQAYRASLDIHSQAEFPAAWAQSNASLASAMFGRAQLERNRAAMLEARARMVEVRDFVLPRDPRYGAFFDESVAAFDAALALTP